MLLLVLGLVSFVYGVWDTTYWGVHWCYYYKHEYNDDTDEYEDPPAKSWDFLFWISRFLNVVQLGLF